MTRVCAHCGSALGPRGRVYCSTRCRKRAWRRRKASLREDSYPAGARRGRVALGKSTAGRVRAPIWSLRGRVNHSFFPGSA